ncbi:heptaprenyl diphosphate synthase component 1 [Aureibacillus halotolerans]|uniref:Heptaprenyl diphosphate synthase n=1 Tax=Aureibacillus halotolerans TaxID=1508390 RepID=A0A4R6UA26_9BACI|nr:heptaprenyl diphosphate synthase component 1 [Aureibacillus halotolerans]TDQ41535.1 heptaprenyl diphosphate synthase [Aureibacillus halotolerans]
MQHIKETIQTLHNKVQAQADHPSLRQSVPLPDIDTDRILFLYTMLHEAGYSDAEKETYIIPVMLVQLALDTHERVQLNSIDVAPAQMEQHQLTVLAGDYYSGLYYRLLSFTGDIPFIRVVAEGIKDINEAKIKMYEQTIGSAEVFADTLIRIESAIVGSVADFLNTRMLKDIAQDFFLLKRLVVGEQLLEQGVTSPFHLADGDFHTPSGGTYAVERIVENAAYRLEKVLRRKPYEFILYRVQEILHHAGHPVRRVAGEGS